MYAKQLKCISFNYYDNTMRQMLSGVLHSPIKKHECFTMPKFRMIL